MPHGIKGILRKSGYNYSEIISKWRLLVGKDISNCSYPKSIKMKKGNTNGTLVLGIKRGDEIIVEYAKREIIEKINSFFGYKVIDEVKLETFSAMNNKNKKEKIAKKFSENLQKKIDEIKNESIKNSLSQLLKEVKND